jgi:hypothetical protein
MNPNNNDPSEGRPPSPANEQAEEFLPPKLAARYLVVSKSYLDKLRVYGGGPKFRRFGRKILYRRTDLNSWAEERSFSSTSEYRHRPIQRQE